MHVKTNIEHDIIQVVSLALCPLLLFLNNLVQAIFYILATTICYLVSAIVCKTFRKYLSRNLKVFVTAILSTFIITLINFAIKKKFLSIEVPEDRYYAVLSTICLSLDAYFVDAKKETKNYFFKILFDCILFYAMVLVFTIFIEILGYGTFFNIKLSKNFAGNEFFRSLPFRLILLGLICAFTDAGYRAYMKNENDKKIVFEKYVKKIREEKFIQYDELRKKKLLTSKIEVNAINEDQLEELNQKLAENETIETKAQRIKAEKEEKIEKAKNDEYKKKITKRITTSKHSSNKNKESREEKAPTVVEDNGDSKNKKKSKGNSKKSKQVERVFPKKDGKK